MTKDIKPEDLLALIAPRIRIEVVEMLETLRAGDFTTVELLGLSAVVRPAYERSQIEKRPPAPVLKLAGKQERKGEVTTA